MSDVTDVRGRGNATIEKEGHTMKAMTVVPQKDMSHTTFVCMTPELEGIQNMTDRLQGRNLQQSLETSNVG